MDNKFGIIGYEIKYGKNINIIDFFLYILFLIVLCSPLFLFCKITFAFFILFMIIFIMAFFYIYFSFKDRKKKVYLFFKDETSRNNFYNNNYKIDNVIYFIWVENIKLINYNNDSYSISYEIDNENINSFNKLKDKCKIVDF